MRRRAAREIVALYAAWPLVHVDLALVLPRRSTSG
jgi:hypothetical protein